MSSNNQPDKTKWRIESEYMCVPQLQNSLPTVTSGPHVQQIQIPMDFESIATYRTSTLEKGYIWQPHFGFDMGLNVDLVDEEAIAPVLPPNMTTKLNIQDKKFLFHSSAGGSSTSHVTKSRGQSHKLPTGDDKPWWLRNPVYIENNLYATTNEFKSSDALKSLTETRIEDDANIFSQDIAEQSFRDVIELEKKYKETHNVISSVPIVPSSNANARLYSHIKYEEDPLGAVGDSEEVESSIKKRRLSHSIAMNSRSLTIAGGSANQNIFAVSLVAPEVVTTPEADPDDLFGDEEDIRETISRVDIESPYTYIKDFKTDVQHKQLQQTFSLFISDKEAAYFPLKSQIAMRKLAASESVTRPIPQEVLVLRQADTK